MATASNIRSHEYSMFFSTSPLLGAYAIAPNGANNRFSVQLKDLLELPANAQNIHLSLTQAGIWWSVVNIKLNVNDDFDFLVGGAPFTFKVPPGLYDVSQLNAAIQRGIQNVAGMTGIIQITGDAPTGKIVISWDNNKTVPPGQTITVNWVAGTMWELLGFNVGSSVPAAAPAPGSELAPNVADFSDVSSFLVSCSLIQSGIPFGNRGQQVLANVQITVPPGSLINYQPFNPPRVSVNHLRGTAISDITIWVQDQLGREVNFNTEENTYLLKLHWETPETTT